MDGPFNGKTESVLSNKPAQPSMHLHINDMLNLADSPPSFESISIRHILPFTQGLDAILAQHAGHHTLLLHSSSRADTLSFAALLLARTHTLARAAGPGTPFRPSRNRPPSPPTPSLAAPAGRALRDSGDGCGCVGAGTRMS